jgi:hypothetical protein
MLFLSFLLLGILSGNESMTVGVALIFTGFALFPLYIFVEYFRGRHEIVDGGLRYGRVFGPRGKMTWLGVQKVRYAQWAKWFTLESRTGEVARVSVIVQDITELAKAILENVQPSAIDETTAAILAETADGNPPPMMGGRHSSSKSTSRR